MALKYLRPTIEMLAMDFNLLCDSGPDAGDIGSPNVRTKSIWDEDIKDNEDIDYDI